MTFFPKIFNCLSQKTLLLIIFRSSRPELFLRKGVLKICSKFTGEHPCRSVISIKLLCNFIEVALRHGCSPVNLLHIFRTPFLKSTSGWLLLNFLLPKVSIKFALQSERFKVFSYVVFCFLTIGFIPVNFIYFFFIFFLVFFICFFKIYLKVPFVNASYASIYMYRVNPRKEPIIKGHTIS